jgi:uncharacterized membrane protein YfhO
MRVYQDLVDVAGMRNPLVWQLMNVKYIFTNRPDSSNMFIPVYQGNDMHVYAFRYYLPHTFFVRRCEIADGMTTLNHIASMSFDPRDVAYVAEKTQTSIDPPEQGAEVTLVRYGTQDLEMQATATGNNLLFLSDAYYPKGWKAFVDGNETEILKIDYLFRGIIVPKGTHSITMKFEPASFYFGKTVSLISSLLVWGAWITIVVLSIKHKRAF